MIQLRSQMDLMSHADSRNMMETRLWTRESMPTNPKQQDNYFNELTSSAKFWGIFESQSPIGMAGLTDIDHVHKKAEFSLLIYSGHRGKGHGTKALIQLCNYGFDILNLDTIWGETFCYPKEAKKLLENYNQKLLPLNGIYKDIPKGGDWYINPAAIVFNNIGFQMEGFLRDRYYKFGHKVNTVICSVRREEWAHSTLSY